MSSSLPAGITLRNNPATAFIRRTLHATPPVTKAMILMHMATLTITILPSAWASYWAVRWTTLCVAPLMDPQASVLAMAHRFALAPLFHTEFVQGAFACFALYVLGTRIEHQKGSIAFGQMIATLWVLGQAGVVFAVSLALSSESVAAATSGLHLNWAAQSPSDQSRIPVWGASPSSLVGLSAYSWSALTSFSIPTQSCATGPWGIVFALMVFECTVLTKDRRRHVFGLPFAVSPKLIPLILLAFHSVWFGLQLSVLVGFVLGYAFCFVPFLLLPASILRLAEQGVCVALPNFVSVDRAGKMQPWSHYVVEDAAAAASASVSRPAAARAQSNRAVNRSFDPVRRTSGASSSSVSSSSDEDVPSGVRAHSPAVVRASPVDLEVASSEQSAQLAANVARILEPAYPKQQAAADSRSAARDPIFAAAVAGRSARQ